MIDTTQNPLWAAADNLRTNMDAAEYKHIALGLIFQITCGQGVA